MSGTNRLVNSIITKKKGSNSELTSALDNANNFVAGKEETKSKNKKAK